jgi:hypothetical protein
MPIAAKRPCRICRRWFRPNVRIGDGQHTCSRPECQAARRKQTQASWRARNPDYFVGYRIQSRAAREGKPEPMRLPAVLSKLPWDIAQEEFGAKGADFIGAMSRLLLEAAKDPIEGQVIDSSIDPGPLPPTPAKDPIIGQVIDSAIDPGPLPPIPRKTRSGVRSRSTMSGLGERYGTGVSPAGFALRGASGLSA